MLKDIVCPNMYIPAGAVKERWVWAGLFPNMSDYKWNDWFISIEIQPAPAPKQPDTIVNEVFKKHGLHSMSYKQAAIAACQQYEEFILTEMAESKDK